MMRRLASLGLFAAAVLAAANADLSGQPPAKKADPKNKFAPPAAVKPDDATLKLIAAKTAELRTAVAGLKAKGVPDDVLAEVEVHLKAADNIVKFNEWFHRDSGKWTLLTLDRGLERAKAAAGGKAPWRDEVGRWVLRAYRSKVDGSVQPYAVLTPHEYGKDPTKKWRLDVVLHGRDGSLTEAKFIATHDRNGKEAPKDQDFVQLEVYGRGNNAFRWAGERDIWEAEAAFPESEQARLGRPVIDTDRRVLRGFSMGGAGTWHHGLHHPFHYAVIGPGAGFTTTRGYIKDLPAKLPDHQERCLHIYDAVDYAENARHAAVVAYSGEKDAQKLAADNIENALKNFPEKRGFTHLVAPGLEHQMPPEWQAKAQAAYKPFADAGRVTFPEKVRVVTYTPRYAAWPWGRVEGMDRMYDRTVVEGEWTAGKLDLKTTNVRSLRLSPSKHPFPAAATIDGQSVPIPAGSKGVLVVEKTGGKWQPPITLEAWQARLLTAPEKVRYMQGPIDDAFMDGFVIVKPAAGGWHDAAIKRFAGEWEKYFRGVLPTADPAAAEAAKDKHLVLFGDPKTNPLIAKVLPKLPITWTADKLVVNGVEYDPKTHVPVLVYPNPLNPTKYLVLNSGHTFREAELKGTNAQLYPRLGDWAVLKPAPTDKDPAAAEVVAAGLFDEFWKFAKK